MLLFTKIFHSLSVDDLQLVFFFSSVTMVENLSNVSFRAVLEHIQADFADFLRLPHYKQTNLAEKAVAELVKHQHELYEYCICFVS